MKHTESDKINTENFKIKAICKRYPQNRKTADVCASPKIIETEITKTVEQRNVLIVRIVQKDQPAQQLLRTEVFKDGNTKKYWTKFLRTTY